MDFTKYIRTDLAAESGAPTADQKERERHEGDGYLWECRPLCEGAELSSLTILNAEGAERFGRECGRYITLSFGDIWLLGDEEKAALCRQLTFQLLQLAQASAPNYRRVLVCGLGNRDLTTDAIGPLTVRSLQVNRHILPPEEPEPRVELSAFCPGVLGQTGIESADLVLAAVRHVRPDLVILLDALAARDEARLARTVQLSDTGLAPGSGIGNHRRPLNRDTLGVPVIAMGVPTVVSLRHPHLRRTGKGGAVRDPRGAGTGAGNRKVLFCIPQGSRCRHVANRRAFGIGAEPCVFRGMKQRIVSYIIYAAAAVPCTRRPHSAFFDHGEVNDHANI